MNVIKDAELRDTSFVVAKKRFAEFACTRSSFYKNGLLDYAQNARNLTKLDGDESFNCMSKVACHFDTKGCEGTT